MLHRRTLVIPALASLFLAACGGGGDGDAGTDGTGTTSETAAAVPDGPTITVASFNFPESTLLAEMYAQTLEDAGYPVERELDLGSREVIFPELQSGELDLLPEYVGSALAVGFGGEATSDLEESTELLREEFAAQDVEVLEPAPGQNQNVYVVRGDYAEENDLTAISDLAGLGDITLAGAPECETRPVCYAGLTDGAYSLDNLAFQPIQETAVRVASLRDGDVEVAALFSTQPVIEQEGFVPLEDDEGLTPVENIVPVVSTEVVEAYGEDMAALLDEVTALVTTEALIDLNTRIEVDAMNPADVASDFLSEQGVVG